jgi:hypothetical protein
LFFFLYRKNSGPRGKYSEIGTRKKDKSYVDTQMVEENKTFHEKNKKQYSSDEALTLPLAIPSRRRFKAKNNSEKIPS